MAKYSKELAETIADLHASTDLTINQICEKVDIHPSTYFEWKETKTEFSDILKAKNSEYLENLRKMARKGLYKNTTGYEYEEEKIEYEIDEKGEYKEKSKTVTKKVVPPNQRAIEYSLNNTDSDNFKSINHVDHTTKGKKLNTSPTVNLTNVPTEVLRQLQKDNPEEDESND